MSLDITDLDELVRKMRQTRSALLVAMPAAAAGVETVLRASIAAGQTPDGQTWAAKKDGGKPLAHAAAKLSVKARGSTIKAQLDMPEAIHQYGSKRGLPARPMLPSKGGEIPPAVAAAVNKALLDAFKRWFG